MPRTQLEAPALLAPACRGELLGAEAAVANEHIANHQSDRLIGENKHLGRGRELAIQRP